MEVGGYDLFEVVVDGVGCNVGFIILYSDDIDVLFIIVGVMF